MTTPTENKAVVRRYYEEAFNEGRTDLLEELIAEDVVNHDPLSDETLTSAQAHGFEGFRRHVEVAREGFSGATVTIDEMIAEGDMVAVRFEFAGTHDGRFGGLEPTGGTVSMSNIGMFRLEDGKIAERWLRSDDVSFLEQLGVLSLTGPAPEPA